MFCVHRHFLLLRHIALASAALLFVSGCAVKRGQYDVPTLNLPSQYAKAPNVVDASGAALTPAQVLSSPLSAALAEWWRLLGSEELNGLMDRALANNPDLRIAALRIAQSQARMGQAGADFLPSVSMPIQMRTDYPEFGAGRGNASGINTTRATDQISLKADWRPDIWGETSSLYDSARMQVLRATYQRDDMQRTVAANVVITYLEYLSLNDRIRVARETENSLREMLASVDGRLEIGDATITEMEQQKAAVYSVQATIPLLEQQRQVVLSRLAGLVGAAPVALDLSDKGLDSAKFPAVLPGVPSALLLRRPDVRAVEARLLAADADIDVARTRLFPPLDLSAQAGYGTMLMSQLLTPQSLFWNTMGSLTVSIFDGGKRSKEVEFARAMHEELLETYVRVIYDAVREVDDSLSGINSIQKRMTSQSMAADSSLRAWNYSQEVFMAGVVDYIVLLDTQRTYQRNMDDWYNVRLESYRNLTNLFSALGGGVTSGDAMPGEGLRPASLTREIEYGAVLGETAEGEGAIKNSGTESLSVQLDATQYNRGEADGVDWQGKSWRSGEWLVELSGVYDRGAVLPAWRDLHARFPQRIEQRILLPQRQGLVKNGEKERASWYRLYIAAFSDRKKAEEYCAGLAAGQQRCEVVSSGSISGKGDFAAPPLSAQNAISEAVVMAVKTGKRADAADKVSRQPEGVADKTPVQVLLPGPAGQKTGAEVTASATTPERLIELWRKDWSGKNAEAYLSHYDIGFRPEKDKDRAAWEINRRKRIGEAESIKVRVKKLQIQLQGERMAIARFVESLQVGNYKKTSYKKLQLIRSVLDDEWRICEEREISQAEFDAHAAAPTEKLPVKEGAGVETVPVQAAAAVNKFEGVDWSGPEFWLVEMTDVRERKDIANAWRDLRARFPEQMKNLAMLTRRQAAQSGAEDVAGYRLLLAKFPEQDMAEKLCAVLREGSLHCGTVSSRSLAEKEPQP
jgi:NodT family efflux transporter outer membrane factor (OMF) lipoprotein